MDRSPGIIDGRTCSRCLAFRPRERERRYSALETFAFPNDRKRVSRKAQPEIHRAENSPRRLCFRSRYRKTIPEIPVSRREGQRDSDDPCAERGASSLGQFRREICRYKTPPECHFLRRVSSTPWRSAISIARVNLISLYSANLFAHIERTI